MRAFVPNPDFVEELFEDQGDEVRAGLRRAAEPAREAAETFAHRVMPRQEEQMVIEDTEDGVAIVNTDYGGHLDESGSANNPPNAPLRRGVLAVGLRFEDEGSDSGD